jgi:3-oxoacyl-[acyl-carrier protein] reductase
MNLNLKDKIAIVCGASRGLGFATARLLAQEGARVVINSRSPEKLAAAAAQIQHETGASVLTIAGDVTDPAFPAMLVSQVAEQLGGIDILITNGGGPQAGPFEALDEAAWQRGLELSLMSHVRLIRAALPWLKKSSSASVLTVTSVSVKQPLPGLILSNSIRAATAGLTKTLALELGSLGIRFNSILPGWTETERVGELLGIRARNNSTTLEEETRKQAREAALGRLGQPAEFAAAAVFLVSPAASYITGVMLNVDGGSYKGTF